MIQQLGASLIPLVKRLFVLALLVSTNTFAQVVGKTTTEDYQADFEKRASIYEIPEYNGDPVPVALLNIGITQDILTQYPELGDYRVGLGLTNITVAFLDETFRFEFVETKDEIKDRMVTQFKASQKGFTENKINIMGKIVLAKYFIYIEVYDFSISEDETINLKDGVKNRDSLFHTLTLSTFDGESIDSRVMVLREFNQKERRLRFHTDARSKKIKDLMTLSKLSEKTLSTDDQIQTSSKAFAEIGRAHV